MTDVDDDAFAFNDWAVQKRREKAVVVARHLYGEGVTVDVAEALSEVERKAQEKAAGVRTSHRDALWLVVVEALRARYDWDARQLPPPPGPEPEPEHVPEPVEPEPVEPEHVPEPEPVEPPPATPAPPAHAEQQVSSCGCPTGPGLPDWDDEQIAPKHRAWHALVVEQGGPVGAVNMQTLRAARGLRTSGPDMHKIAARNERQGKSSPGWRRNAAR